MMARAFIRWQASPRKLEAYLNEAGRREAALPRLRQPVRIVLSLSLSRVSLCCGGRGDGDGRGRGRDVNETRSVPMLRV